MAPLDGPARADARMPPQALAAAQARGLRGGRARGAARAQGARPDRGRGAAHGAPTRVRAIPDALLAHFGFAEFRPGQREAVQAALAGRDSLVVMPTGGGKSLCYQLPGIATANLTVVVSPLIALMADQYRGCCSAATRPR